MLSPLIVDQKDQPEDELDAEDFSEEQHTVARFINLLEATEPDQQYVVSVQTVPTPLLCRFDTIFFIELLLYTRIQCATSYRRHNCAGLILISDWIIYRLQQSTKTVHVFIFLRVFF